MCASNSDLVKTNHLCQKKLMEHSDTGLLYQYESPLILHHQYTSDVRNGKWQKILLISQANAQSNWKLNFQLLRVMQSYISLKMIGACLLYTKHHLKQKPKNIGKLNLWPFGYADLYQNDMYMPLCTKHTASEPLCFQLLPEIHS